MRRLVDGEHVGGDDARLEGTEHFGDAASHASQADDADRRVVQIARGTADELALFLGLEKYRKAPQPGGDQGHGVFCYLVGQNAGSAGHQDVGDLHRRNKAMVHAGRRRLNPLQPASLHNGIPINRHLGMAAEDIGLEQLLGHSLLPGIDHLAARRCRANLLKMPRFNWITEDDAH